MFALCAAIASGYEDERKLFSSEGSPVLFGLDVPQRGREGGERGSVCVCVGGGGGGNRQTEHSFILDFFKTGSLLFITF